MSALVESMFSVREVPWHREGIVLGDYPGSWAEARTAAGIDWDVLTEATYALTGMNETGPVFEPIPGFKRVYRNDTQATLSVVNDTYTVIDHAAMGEIIEAVLGLPNVKYETAGSLDKGKAVWCLARLDEPIELPGDKTVTYPYLAITNRHDAMGGCTLRATAVRIVCMNTFKMSELEGERTGATFSFRHTKGWRDRIADAKEAVTGARKEMRAYEELSRELLTIRVTPRQAELFVRAFIPSPPDGIISDRVAGNIEQARNAVRGILASVTCEGINDTGYGLVQAAGEYLDHVRVARTWETRMNRSLLSPESSKGRALKIVRSLVGSDA